jgi:hypothetical protein
MSENAELAQTWQRQTDGFAELAKQTIADQPQGKKSVKRKAKK